MSAPEAGISLERSRRLWSLWEMINFRFSGVYHILTELGVLVRVSDSNLEHIQDVGRRCGLLDKTEGSEILTDCRRNSVQLTELAKKVFERLQCSHIDSAIARLVYWANDPDEERAWRELNVRARALRDAVDTELKDYYYYEYPKTKAAAVLSWKTDWSVVIEKFQNTEIDVFSAVDCHALAHQTAAVFHCMRILERGLGALAERVGLVFDVQQWNNIIEQIESKIAEMRKNLPRGQEKNETMQFLSEAAKEFFYFKDGWRNYVSHNRGNYDEHQARSVLEHVRTFMTVLANGL